MYSPTHTLQQRGPLACYLLSACFQILGDFLAQINHHEGIYNKLVTVQQVYRQSLAAANSSDPADQQLQHQVRGTYAAQACGNTQGWVHQLLHRQKHLPDHITDICALQQTAVAHNAAEQSAKRCC